MKVKLVDPSRLKDSLKVNLHWYESGIYTGRGIPTKVKNWAEAERYANWLQKEYVDKYPKRPGGETCEVWVYEVKDNLKRKYKVCN